MHRTSILIALALGSAAAVSCVQTSYILNPDHCSGAQDGDSFCAEQFADGSKPFCRFGSEPCNPDTKEPEFFGCVDVRPEDECYSPCGRGNDFSEDASCLDDVTTVADATMSTSSSSTGEPSTSTEDPDTGSGTEEPSTTGPECVEDEECLDAAAPFCTLGGSCVACDGMEDPDGACAQADESRPVCEGGECVQCTDANATACEGVTPICGVENACVGCTEHGECPQSACHLDGADAGGCFEVADVQEVANTGELESALDGLGADDQAVLVLAAGTYGETASIPSDSEVAILGPASASLQGGGGFGLSVASGAIAYVAGPTVANGNDTGVRCIGESLWVDDSEVRNNAQVGLDVSGGCAAHLRRSIVAVNNGGGIDASGGELHMVNSVVGRNGDELTSLFGGLSANGTMLEVTYSAFVGNEATNGDRASIFCAGGESGEMRNSIIVAGGDSVDGCAVGLLDNNAVDGGGLGATNENVGSVMAGWFVNLGANDYRLTASGQTEFMDIAQWVERDPLTDIDGDAIPTDVPSFPGYDQP